MTPRESQNRAWSDAVSDWEQEMERWMTPSPAPTLLPTAEESLVRDRRAVIRSLQRNPWERRIAPALNHNKVAK